MLSGGVHPFYTILFCCVSIASFFLFFFASVALLEEFEDMRMCTCVLHGGRSLLGCLWVIGPFFVMNVCQLRSYIMLDNVCVVLGLSLEEYIYVEVFACVNNVGGGFFYRFFDVIF